ncbi:hypothetical protein [Corticimicrobacter populi]|uniref:hypothetical protein n=1 Tax=Corticimicrobacter populi TaxID=2175229 RepID=UPI0011B22A0E|nr:hypothetical protein [Corticimicrobacter populi]
MKLLSWLSLALGWFLILGTSSWGLAGVLLVALFALIQYRLHSQPDAAPTAMQQPEEDASTAEPDTAVPVARPPEADNILGELLNTPSPSGIDPEQVPYPPSSLPALQGLQAGTLSDDPSLRPDTPARWRRVLWASYGNAYLQDALSLDDWYRHGTLWEATCPFLSASDRSLVAHDGFEWLSMQKRNGALRLSLEDYTAVLPDFLQAQDRQALVCHFADRCEVWLLASDQSLYQRTHQDGGPRFGIHLPAMDSYWQVARLPAQGPTPAIHWVAEQTRIGDILTHYGHPWCPSRLTDHNAPYYRWGYWHDTDWAVFSIVPEDPAIMIPHGLFRDLTHMMSQFENDTNLKNEGNLLMQTTEKGVERLQAHGRMLAQLLDYTQRLAAAETRWRPLIGNRRR